MQFLYVLHEVTLVSAGKGSIDKANDEIRNIILRIWPKTSMDLLDKVVQDPEGRKGEQTRGPF